MPRRDGTGPLGQGSLTGRGMGLCFYERINKETKSTEEAPFLRRRLRMRCRQCCRKGFFMHSACGTEEE